MLYMCQPHAKLGYSDDSTLGGNGICTAYLRSLLDLKLQAAIGSRAFITAHICQSGLHTNLVFRASDGDGPLVGVPGRRHLRI